MNEPTSDSAGIPAPKSPLPPPNPAGGRNPLEYLLLIFVAAAGCWAGYVHINSKDGFTWREFLFLGAGKPQLVPVTGQVFFNGEPMVDGMVTAYPADPAAGLKMALGPLDAEGKFELLTDVDGLQPGALVGTYKLVLGINYPLQSGQLAPNHRLPGKYYDASTTPVSITVTKDADKNHFVIKEEGEEQPPPGGGRRGRRDRAAADQPAQEETSNKTEAAPLEAKPPPE